MLNFRVLAVLALAAAGPASAFAQSKAQYYAKSLAPYIVSPQVIVDRMLEIADVKAGETVYDLGCGDGRILITAVQRFRAKAVGIELSEPLARSTSERIVKLGLQNDVHVIQGDV